MQRPLPQFVQVPRPRQSRPNLIYHGQTGCPAVDAWLSQDEKEVPWHNLASIMTPSASKETVPSTLTNLPSDNGATQGSARDDDTVTEMKVAHSKGSTATLHLSTSDKPIMPTSIDKSLTNTRTPPQPKSVPVCTQQQEPTKTSQYPMSG